ncbi:sulfotransferase family protein [Mycobacterium heidelbergense]|uniref:sulfotransferase family protein n=1 Tax=Mycobacterium heidelbergense TaxID=53376 RepID=UPI003CFB2C80
MQSRELTTVAAQSGPAPRSVILFVLGINRSGTSALTRVLSLCGGALPGKLVGAMADNPVGHWEPRAANYLNETILRRHGSTMFDPTLRLHEDGPFDAEAKAACIAKIRAFLTTLPAAPLVLIKDPRITVLSSVWFDAARQAGFDVVTVIAVRHPQEVIASVAASSGASAELSSALWLKFNLVAERHTRGMPRVFVDYANLLADWRREVKRISAALAIDLDARDKDGAIEEFLQDDLRRQRHCGPVTDSFGTDWISTVYETLGAAARNESWDESALERVYEEYRASEQDFRTAFEDFRRFHKLNRLVRPSIFKLIMEAWALAHRRKGTWA